MRKPKLRKKAYRLLSGFSLVILEKKKTRPAEFSGKIVFHLKCYAPSIGIRIKFKKLTLCKDPDTFLKC